jgi:hypothetical protein
MVDIPIDLVTNYEKNIIAISNASLSVTPGSGFSGEMVKIRKLFIGKENRETLGHCDIEYGFVDEKSLNDELNELRKKTLSY